MWSVPYLAALILSLQEEPCTPAAMAELVDGCNVTLNVCLNMISAMIIHFMLRLLYRIMIGAMIIKLMLG